MKFIKIVIAAIITIFMIGLFANMGLGNLLSLVLGIGSGVYISKKLLFRDEESASVKKSGNQSKQKFSNAENKYYADLKNEIFDACWNEKTCVFNWRIWSDKQDLIIHSAPPNILDDIDRQFRYYGCRQILMANAIIRNWIIMHFEDNTEMVRGIEKFQNEIINSRICANLPSMFSMKNGKYVENSCPRKVLEYREKISSFSDKQNVTLEKCREIVKLGDDIYNGII